MRNRESEEMYLETILLLKDKGKSVHAIDIANKLSYAKSSVSRAVSLLIQKKFIIVNENDEINFTDDGLKRAKKIYEKHLILSSYFESLGVSSNIAAIDACRIEHIISDELFKVIKRENNKRIKGN